MTLNLPIHLGDEISRSRSYKGKRQWKKRGSTKNARACNTAIDCAYAIATSLSSTTIAGMCSSSYSPGVVGPFVTMFKANPLHDMFLQFLWNHSKLKNKECTCCTFSTAILKF